MNKEELEALVKTLNDPHELEEYKRPYDNYKPSRLPSILGWVLVTCGNLVYGNKPSYQKFRAVEVIARVPYHSWSSAAFTFLTMFYSHEQKAIQLSLVSRFARLAQDNETMHVVVISQLAAKYQKSNWIVHTFIPMAFAFFYFWIAYLLYVCSHRYALELNYLFEQHAFDQYNLFLKLNEKELKDRTLESEFLQFYGREARTHYEFFMSVRNDEIVHRNRSIREIVLN